MGSSSKKVTPREAMEIHSLLLKHGHGPRKSLTLTEPVPVCVIMDMPGNIDFFEGQAVSLHAGRNKVLADILLPDGSKTTERIVNEWWRDSLGHEYSNNWTEATLRRLLHRTVKTISETHPETI